MANKDAYYFSHDSNARQDDKIIALRMKHGWEGYGIYWAIIEKLRDASGYSCVKDYNIIAFDLRTDAAKIKSIIEDFGLFITDKDSFYSRSLTARMSPRDEAKKSASINGIIGNLVKNGYAKKSDLILLSDAEIILMNQQFKESKKDKTPPGRPPVASRPQREEKKEDEIKGKESKVDVDKKKYPPTTTRDILFSKPISINQWAMKTKVDETRIKECIIEFSEFKERTGENEKWHNDSDLIKNFEFWLNSNARPKIEKTQKNQNNEQREIYRNA